MTNVNVGTIGQETSPLLTGLIGSPSIPDGVHLRTFTDSDGREFMVIFDEKHLENFPDDEDLLEKSLDDFLRRGIIDRILPVYESAESLQQLVLTQFGDAKIPVMKTSSRHRGTSMDEFTRQKYAGNKRDIYNKEVKPKSPQF